MSPWSLLLAVHVSTAVISLSLFVLRGWWLLRDPAVLENKWLRVAPHGNDTLLLASAIGLAVLTRQYPGTDPWLTAKVLGLLLYIGLGVTAFRVARRPAARATVWIGALVVFSYIVLVAVTRDPSALLL